MNTMNHKTKKRFEAVKADVAKGTPVTEACQKNGMSTVTYRKHLGGGSRLVELPRPTSGKAFVFYGSPDAIAEIVRTLQ